MSNIEIQTIIKKDFIPNGVNIYRKEMKEKNLEYMLCETNGLFHKKYYLCKDQQAVDELLEGDMPSTMWYVSDKDKPIKLSIDFDWRLGEDSFGSWAEGEEYYKKICEDFKENIQGIADRSGKTKFSKRIYTNLEFQDTETLKYYVLDYIKKNNYRKDIVDISIYTSNRLYPVVDRNVKDSRTLKWEGGGNFELCNPNNKMDSVKKHFDIPINIKARKKHAKLNLQTKINELEKQKLDTKLFLDLIQIIPQDHWNSYTEWLKLATFCKSFFDFDLFHQISRCGDNYSGEDSCLKLYNGIKVKINAGYMVNIAKSYSEEKVKKVYLKNRMNKETLTEKSIGRMCSYYFGNFFLKVGKNLLYFDKELNKWREFKRRDFIYYIDHEFDQFILPLFKTEEGERNRKLEGRYASMLSSGLNKVIELFGDYITEINEDQFDLHQKDKLFFTNGYYDFIEKKFIYDKDPDWYNTLVINKPYLPVDYKKKTFLNEYFSKLFHTNPEDFEVFKNMIGKTLTAQWQKRLLVLTESGNNGKSSIVGLLEETFGSYSFNTGDSEILALSLSTSKPRCDLQNIKDKRLITMLEPDEDIKLNASTVKQITGGDKISARGYFAPKPVKFINHGLILIGANTMPQMNKVDKAIQSRMVCIGMKSKFLEPIEYEKYKHLDNVFLGNADLNTGSFFNNYADTCLHLIINWANEYRNTPIKLTESIEEYTNDYLNDDNVIDWFFENYELTGDDVFIEMKTLHPIYKAHNTGDALGKYAFNRILKAHPSTNYRKSIKRNNKPTKNIFYGFRKIEESLESDEE